MQDRQRLNFLIDKAASIYGSDGKLAGAMGTTRQTLSNWRHGYKEPSTDVQARLAEIAGIDVGMTVAAAAIEKTGNEQAIKWLESQLAKIRKL
jgi:transcriptional regulator with XRE-family HTH domain